MGLRALIIWAVLLMVAMGPNRAQESGQIPEGEAIFESLEKRIAQATKDNSTASRENLLRLHLAIIQEYKAANPTLAARLDDLSNTIKQIADKQLFAPEAYLFRFLAKEKSRDFLEGVRIEQESISQIRERTLTESSARHHNAQLDVDDEEAVIYLLSTYEKTKNSCTTRQDCLNATMSLYTHLKTDIRQACPSCNAIIKKIDDLEMRLLSYASQEQVATESIVHHWRKGTIQDHLESLTKTDAAEFWSRKRAEIRSGRYPRLLNLTVRKNTVR